MSFSAARVARERMKQRLQAYSRAASALFADASDDGELAQPVLYMGPTLRVDVGPCQAGTRLHCVSVDWWCGAIALYASSADRLNATPLYAAREGAWPCGGVVEDTETYVRETYAFLLRGHSLRTPGCLCGGIGKKRAGRGGKCPIDSAAAWPRLEDLGRELSVRSMHGYVDVMRRGRRVVRMPLLRVLTELAGLQLSPDGLRIGSPACCLPLHITSAEDVLRAAELLAPRPYVYDPRPLDPLTQSEVHRGLAELQRRLHVRVLESDTEGAHAVFFNKHMLRFELSSSGDMVKEAWTRAGAVAPPRPTLPPPQPSAKRKPASLTPSRKKARLLVRYGIGGR